VKQRYGHAAHVDSPATHPAGLTTIAWTRGTYPHAHNAGDYFFFSKFNVKKGKRNWEKAGQ
jgi:hypothetical protein